jgi:hypothetical protein
MTTVANILTNVGYRLFPDGSTAIGTSSEPTQAECIQWINETCEELLTVCIETNSELGRRLPASGGGAGSAPISLVDGTSQYSDYASYFFSPVIYRENNGDQFSGWIEKTRERVPLRLFREEDLINYDPSLEKEPEGFYVSPINTFVFVPTPDTSYTAIIPYYPYHTTLTATTDTIPFLKVFDHVITEAVVLRAQNREEYDLGFELKWFGHIRAQARKIIMMRKNPKTKISV